jgi:hypothetical protein
LNSFFDNGFKYFANHWEYSHTAIVCGLRTNDEEIAKTIRSINRGKSADYHGLTIEHIINAGKDMEKLLLITNEIFKQ